MHPGESVHCQRQNIVNRSAPCAHVMGAPPRPARGGGARPAPWRLLRDAELCERFKQGGNGCWHLACNICRVAAQLTRRRLQPQPQPQPHEPARACSHQLVHCVPGTAGRRRRCLRCSWQRQSGRRCVPAGREHPAAAPPLPQPKAAAQPCRLQLPLCAGCCIALTAAVASAAAVAAAKSCTARVVGGARYCGRCSGRCRADHQTLDRTLLDTAM